MIITILLLPLGNISNKKNYEDELGADLKDEEHARYATTRSQHQQGLDLFLVGLWTSRTENIA